MHYEATDSNVLLVVMSPIFSCSRVGRLAFPPFVRCCKILELSAGIPLKHRHIKKRIALFYDDVSVGEGGGGTNGAARNTME